MNNDIQSKILKIIQDNKIILFMKGTKEKPQCGFSANAIKILDELIDDYHTINVLENPKIRKGIKEFSDWPTIPQLYIQEKFIGGCDIVQEMMNSGELLQILKIDIKVNNKIKIEINKEAQEKIKQFLNKFKRKNILRISVNAQYEHFLNIDDKKINDTCIDYNEFQVIMNKLSSSRANGLKITFHKKNNIEGFKIYNPNAPIKPKKITTLDLKNLLKSDKKYTLLDIRKKDEWNKSHLKEAILLCEKPKTFLKLLNKKDKIIIVCNFGNRSLIMAKKIIKLGFQNVYSLSGGISEFKP